MISSHLTELYDPKAFITHAALLRQGFPHCAKFLTAASRRSLDRVSVPVWLIILSDQLTIGLGRPLPYQQANGTRAHPQTEASKERPPLISKTEVQEILSGISIAFAMLSPIRR